jgi:hypothetical protein
MTDRCHDRHYVGPTKVGSVFLGASLIWVKVLAVGDILARHAFDMIRPAFG